MRYLVFAFALAFAVCDSDICGAELGSVICGINLESLIALEAMKIVFLKTNEICILLFNFFIPIPESN